MTVEINAKEFVDWLFTVPVQKSMKPMRAAQATAVSRRLAELAHSKPELNFLWGLATDVWKQTMFLPDGRVATNEECTEFLREFKPYFLNHDLDTAFAAIAETLDVKGPRIPRDPTMVDYRTVERMLYVPAQVKIKRSGKKPPPDDLSERIGIAVHVMTEAQCTRPAAAVAAALRKSDVLPEYCTVAHVTSRYKARGARNPLWKETIPFWLESYWRCLHPELVDTHPQPPEFVFLKCDC